MSEKNIVLGKTIIIGDKVVPISGYDANGKPIIKIRPEDCVETKHPDGRVDITINVPCFRMELKEKLSEEK